MRRRRRRPTPPGEASASSRSSGRFPPQSLPISASVIGAAPQQRHELAQVRSPADPRGVVGRDRHVAEEVGHLGLGRPLPDPHRVEAGVAEGHRQVALGRDAIVGPAAESVEPESRARTGRRRCRGPASIVNGPPERVLGREHECETRLMEPRRRLHRTVRRGSTCQLPPIRRILAGERGRRAPAMRRPVAAQQSEDALERTPPRSAPARRIHRRRPRHPPAPVTEGPAGDRPRRPPPLPRTWRAPRARRDKPLRRLRRRSGHHRP